MIAVVGAFGGVGRPAPNAEETRAEREGDPRRTRRRPAPNAKETRAER